MQVIETLNSKISTTKSELEATQTQLEKHRNEGNFEKEVFAQTRFNALGDVLKRYEEELATAQAEEAQKQAQQEIEALETELQNVARESDTLWQEITAEEKKCDEYLKRSHLKTAELLEQHWRKRDEYRQLIRRLGFNGIEQIEVLNETLQRLEVKNSSMRYGSLLRGELWHERHAPSYPNAEIRHMQENMR